MKWMCIRGYWYCFYPEYRHWNFVNLDGILHPITENSPQVKLYKALWAESGFNSNRYEDSIPSIGIFQQTPYPYRNG